MKKLHNILNELYHLIRIRQYVEPISVLDGSSNDSARMAVSLPNDVGKSELHRGNGYWKSLTIAERRAILCREAIYRGNSDALRTAISGQDYRRYLHFLFKSPEEGLDALTALQTFEHQKNRTITLDFVPGKIKRNLDYILRLPQETHKREVVAYVLREIRPCRILGHYEQLLYEKVIYKLKRDK